MDIRNIAIIGAGAMGAAYAAMFSEVKGLSVAFLARGERFRRLREGPLNINGEPYGIPVIHPDSVQAPADLILVALKHHLLRDALPDIKAVCGRRTTILSVMNGLESEEIIGGVCGMEKLVLAIAVGIDAVREGSLFTYAHPGRIVFGAGPQTDNQGRVEQLRNVLDLAGIPNEVPEDIDRAMWWKFMVNVGINQASAVLKAPYHVFQSSPDARALMKALMQEVILLAQAVNIRLFQNDLDEWFGVLSGLSPTGKTSMLQDVEAGRKTEVDIFAGKVVAMGKEHHVPTPVNETIRHIIKTIESRNDPG